MAVTLQSLGIDQLSLEDQLTLMHDLWEHLTQQGNSPTVSAEQLAELRRRVAEMETSPDDEDDWDTVHQALLERVQKCPTA